MDTAQLRGTGVALVTPFLKNLEVDYPSLEKIIHHIIEGGCNYIVVLGTTGEPATLSPDEKKEIFSFTSKVVNSRVPLVAGIGGNNTTLISEEIKAFQQSGYDAILSVSPYYNRPTQEGIYQHFVKIAEQSTLPVIIYNVPARTGSNITATTTLRIARASERIIAVKEASGNMVQCMQLIKEKPAGFSIISGDDILTLPFLALGMDGLISVVANAFPKEISSLTASCLAGDYGSAQRHHYHLLSVMDLLFTEGNPAGVKAALYILHLCHNQLRLPLLPLSDDTFNTLRRAIACLNEVETTAGK